MAFFYFMILAGIIIVSIATGHMNSEEMGWLTLGIGVIFWGGIGAILRYLEPGK